MSKEATEENKKEAEFIQRFIAESVEANASSDAGSIDSLLAKELNLISDELGKRPTDANIFLRCMRVSADLSRARTILRHAYYEAQAVENRMNCEIDRAAPIMRSSLLVSSMKTRLRNRLACIKDLKLSRPPRSLFSNAVQEFVLNRSHPACVLGTTSLQDPLPSQLGSPMATASCEFHKHKNKRVLLLRHGGAGGSRASIGSSRRWFGVNSTKGDDVLVFEKNLLSLAALLEARAKTPRVRGVAESLHAAECARLLADVAREINCLEKFEGRWAKYALAKTHPRYSQFAVKFSDVSGPYGIQMFDAVEKQEVETNDVEDLLPLLMDGCLEECIDLAIDSHKNSFLARQEFEEFFNEKLGIHLALSKL
jgi:hypothetical protein